MTTANTSWMATYNNADTAAFRAWGQAISAAIQATGWVKTSDTGQIDWATATVPTLANTSKGYEVYRLNDALQATYPIFIRIDYGAGYAVAASGIRIQIGTGTDGAGVISGLMFDSYPATWTGGTNYNLGFSNASIGTPMTNYASGNGEFIALMLNPQAYANNAINFLFERSRDSSGNPTGDGIFIGMCGQVGNTAVFSRIITAAYGSSTRYMIMNLAVLFGTMTPLSVMGVTTFPMTPVSASMSNPLFYKVTVTIPGVRSWALRHFLQPPTHADATLTPSFRTDPDGKGAKVFRAIPLGSNDKGLFGYTTTNSIPVAFMWAD